MILNTVKRGADNPNALLAISCLINSSLSSSRHQTAWIKCADLCQVGLSTDIEWVAILKPIEDDFRFRVCEQYPVPRIASAPPIVWSRAKEEPCHRDHQRMLYFFWMLRFPSTLGNVYSLFWQGLYNKVFQSWPTLPLIMPPWIVMQIAFSTLSSLSNIQSALSYCLFTTITWHTNTQTYWDKQLYYGTLKDN